MPLFKYRALEETGRKVSGRIEAENVADLELRLTHQQLTLLEAKPVNKSNSRLGGRSVTRKDLITFCFHLEQMTKAGVPLLEGLIDLRDTMDNKSFKDTLSSVIESIQNGKTLSQSLAEYGNVFDPIFVNLIRTGEQSGQLSNVLKSLVESLKWQDELASQTKSIMIYPIIMLTAVTLAAGVLMVKVVPEMTKMIQDMGQELPLQTRALIATSDFIGNYWYLILASPFIVGIGLSIAKKRYSRVHYQIDNFKLHIWLVGPILKKIILTRFANYFALLYASGITIISCINITEGIVGNLVVANALKEVQKDINDGRSIYSSIERTKLFPPLVLRMIKVGESTGALDEALLNISYFYNREVQESIEKLQAMLTPAMTFIVFLIIGWVSLAVFGPVYDLMTKIKI